MDRATPWVVLVTDPRVPLSRTLEVVRAAAAALGPDRLLVQLRDKEASQDDLLEAARALRKATCEARARLVVNGSSSVALAAGADGVHFPKTSPTELVHLVRAARGLLGAEAIVTTVAHDDDDVTRASEAGATGVLVSPIFATPGKGAPRGVAALTAARAIVDAMRRSPRLLVVALGGVTSQNAAACLLAGAAGVAAIRALYDAPASLAAFGASGAARSPAP